MSVTGSGKTAGERDRAADKRSDTINLLICAVLSILALLIVSPFYEMGVCDDFSYAKTSLDLANTGHLIYNGWSTAMVGFQAVYGAAAIKLFGFSFAMLRLTTGPFAILSAILTYLLHRRLGLRPQFALFGTLALVLSPLFLPLVGTFMTDIPGMVFFLLAVYAAIRTLENPPPREAVLWMTLSTVLVLIGGTIRQSSWVVGLSFLPFVIWRERKATGGIVFRSAAVQLLVTFAVILACTRWFNHQPYALIDSLAQVPPAKVRVAVTAGMLLHLPNTFVISLIVLLFAVFTDWETLRLPGAKARSLIFPVAILLLTYVIGHYAPKKLPLQAFINYDSQCAWPYWMGMLSPKGIMCVEFELGANPILIPKALCWLIFFAVLWFMGVMLMAAIRTLRSKKPLLQALGEVPALKDPRQLYLLIVVTLYLTTVMARNLVYCSGLFDRYFLMLMPLVSPILLLHSQARRKSVSTIGWAALVVWGLMTIAMSQTYLEGVRNMALADEALVRQGVPREQITSSLEFDCFTQVQARGHLNEPRILFPPGAYDPTPVVWTGFTSSWAIRTPVIKPSYFVSWSPLYGQLVDAGTGRDYTAWMPPYHRHIYVSKPAPGAQLVPFGSGPLDSPFQ